MDGRRIGRPRLQWRGRHHASQTQDSSEAPIDRILTSYEVGERPQ
jgi:hypothetical protein